MCTAVSYKTKDHYFGRNLDLEYHYNEEVTITPRRYPLHFRRENTLRDHYAMIGMATVADGYPLYYDATNEHGLSMAGLNFPGNAQYHCEKKHCQNITPFELIPWILGQCRCVSEAKSLLERINVLDLPFSEQLPLSPLHWMIADKEASIVAEPTADGLIIYDDPVYILTNNPPFPYHMSHLCDYMNLSAEPAVNRFSGKLPLKPYSNGMGGIGLPGDLSSASRFVRGAFVREHSISAEDESASVSQFFHILSAVEQQRGCVKVNGKYEITLYSSCCNTDKGIYYYTTYENRQITAVHLMNENLDADKVITYPLITRQQIRQLN